LRRDHLDDDHDGMTRLTRAFVRFQENPSSFRYAAAAIISTMVILIFAGALVIQLLSPEEYPNYGEALWFTLQTVTTVGYGDSTPTSGIGRFVASVVMLVSIALITVVTAAITSMLIQSISRPQNEAEQLDFTETLARIEASLAAAQEQLDQLTDAMTSDTDGRHDTR
jgi:voltage-gated potassium channel Kch